MASNLLLDLMPAEVREELLDSGSDLHVGPGQRVSQEDLSGSHVFIVTEGIASKFHIADNGRISEVGMIGSEGLFPVCALLDVPAAPHIVVSLAGELAGRRIRTKDFHRILGESPESGGLVRKYVYAFITQICSNIVSSEQNSMTQRLARWLLMLHDRVDGDEIPITHDTLAQMLSAHRPTVTNTLAGMKELGLIETSRGRVTILSRPALWTLCEGSYGLSERYWNEHISTFGKAERAERSLDAA